jgi:CheY-like chemotaxis protein
VFADRGQLEQVVLNLGTNARAWMPNGGTLTLRVVSRTLGEAEARREDLLPGPWVALEVTDTGPGLDPDTLGVVFEPFVPTGEQDTGLLLASVYGIVRQSGGHVLVESRRQRGTTFTILLPPLLEERRTKSFPQLRLRPASILVVEDDAYVRRTIQVALERAGYTPWVAAGPADALSILESHEGPLDLLLTDVVMPGMSGTQLARVVEGLRPGVRVLYVTGYLDDTTLRHGLEWDVAAIVHKPFKPSALVRRVVEVLATPAPARGD